ncbi:hypothetical protein Pelo_17949 [Pelomyxa schiedti]|nr:hypothetical protein Pelo_17949 [Pelomyxa schiedti]
MKEQVWSVATKINVNMKIIIAYGQTTKLAENQKAVVTCLREKLKWYRSYLFSYHYGDQNVVSIIIQKSSWWQDESGRTHLHQTPAVLTSSASGTRSSTAVLFAKPFSETPRITAWVSQMNSNSTIHKIPQSSISNVSRTGFQVIPGPDWESEFHVDWLAFAQPVVDGKLAGLIQLIKASPATLTPELERNISGCLARPGGVNQADRTGTTLLHAARCQFGKRRQAQMDSSPFRSQQWAH